MPTWCSWTLISVFSFVDADKFDSATDVWLMQIEAVQLYKNRVKPRSKGEGSWKDEGETDEEEEEEEEEGEEDMEETEEESDESGQNREELPVTPGFSGYTSGSQT